MSFEFVHQPYMSGYSLRDYFVDVASGGFAELDIVTAWVKSSGVNAVREPLTALRDRQVTIRAIVGISMGGTSIQGLRELMTLVDELWIFNHRGRTFHPKLYRASNSQDALTFVGSNNLTAGGAINNFEAGTLGRLNLDRHDEARYHNSVLTYIETLRNDAAALRMNEHELATVLSNDRYVISDELSLSATGDEAFSRTGANDEDLFGRSEHPLNRFIPPRLPSDASGQPSDSDRRYETTPANFVVEEDLGDDEARVIRRWFKKLGNIDAQQGRSLNWNPSNTATLVTGGHPIERETYFRVIFFGDLDWEEGTSLGGKSREVARVRADFFVEGEFVGAHDLQLRHTPDYESSQSNRVTELRWGQLSDYMRSTDHTGDFLTLERTTSGEVRIHLSSEPVGAFEY